MGIGGILNGVGVGVVVISGVSVDGDGKAIVGVDVGSDISGDA